MKIIKQGCHRLFESDPETVRVVSQILLDLERTGMDGVRKYSAQFARSGFYLTYSALGIYVPLSDQIPEEEIESRQKVTIAKISIDFISTLCIVNKIRA